jgi:hypothetical protein
MEKSETKRRRTHKTSTCNTGDTDTEIPVIQDILKVSKYRNKSSLPVFYEYFLFWYGFLMKNRISKTGTKTGVTDIESTTRNNNVFDICIHYVRFVLAQTTTDWCYIRPVATINVLISDKHSPPPNCVKHQSSGHYPHVCLDV